MNTYSIYEGENYIYCLCEVFKGSNLLEAVIKKGKVNENKALLIIY